MILCREAQLDSYPEEYSQLKYNKAIPKNSSLLSFKPFTHKSLIWVGGRIKTCRLTITLDYHAPQTSNSKFDIKGHTYMKGTCIQEDITSYH